MLPKDITDLIDNLKEIAMSKDDNKLLNEAYGQTQGPFKIQHKGSGFNIEKSFKSREQAEGYREKFFGQYGDDFRVIFSRYIGDPHEYERER